MFFNFFKAVKPFIQMKSHGESQYVEEFESNRLVRAGRGVGTPGYSIKTTDEIDPLKRKLNPTFQI